MVDNPQGRYLHSDLDPEILAKSFEIQTKWHVITGSSCSGKTTLIEGLAQAGYQTAPETARIYFESEMAKGRTSQEIRSSGNATQMGIFELQRDLEAGLPTDQVVFLDRALPDSLTYHRLFGLYPDELLPACFTYHYALVFLLDRLPFLREVRLGPEDEKPAQFVDEWLERDYAALGYKVVRVPVLPPKKRISFILDRVPEIN